MIKGLYRKEKLESAETIQTGEGKARGEDFTHVYQSRMGGKEDEEAVVFPVVPIDRTRDSGVTEKLGNFI